MYPIILSKENKLEGIDHKHLLEYIMQVCQEHHEANRALSFCFIIYDFENPQIIKILEDFKLWKALDTLSGKYLTLFYTRIQEQSLTEDIKRFNGFATKDMHGVDSNNLAKLQHFIEYKGNLPLPLLLFFQSNGRTILDAFIVKLKEKKIEDSYLEIVDYIAAAVEALKKIEIENKDNFISIFEMVKIGLKTEKQKKSIHRFISKFPAQLLLNWIVGKV